MTIVETYEPTGSLKPVADGLWIVDGPVIGFGYLGMKFPFPTRMTIVQLADGGLWVHSPTELPPRLRACPILMKSTLKRAFRWLPGISR